jgi:hypothetical protein
MLTKRRSDKKLLLEDVIRPVDVPMVPADENTIAAVEALGGHKLHKADISQVCGPLPRERVLVV